MRELFSWDRKGGEELSQAALHVLLDIQNLLIGPGEQDVAHPAARRTAGQIDYGITVPAGNINGCRAADLNPLVDVIVTVPSKYERPMPSMLAMDLLNSLNSIERVGSAICYASTSSSGGE